MTNQKLIAGNHFPILVKILFTRLRKLAIFRKSKFLMHYDCLFSKTWFFGIVHLYFQKIYQKVNLKILKNNVPQVKIPPAKKW